MLGSSVSIILLLLMSLTHLVLSEGDLKCLVCQRVVTDIISAIESEDPRKKIQIGSFRIQPDGSQKQTEVKYAGSQLHIHEILETVCNPLDDYAQAKHKETGAVALLNLSKDVEKLSIYELIPDPDLNRGLKYHCQSFLEDYEDDILAELSNTSKSTKKNSKEHLCQITTGYCNRLNQDEARVEL